MEEGNDEENYNKNNLNSLLRKYLMKNSKIDAAAIVSAEGLPIITSFSDRLNNKVISSMTATLFSLTNMAINELKLGDFNELYIKGKNGYLIILQAGENAVLIVSTKIKVQLGVILFKCKQLCNNIARLLE
ncbi:MAG: roadblock/LC7 domain-containing protein [Candidatus Hodarchaeota archaeon]